MKYFSKHLFLSLLVLNLFLLTTSYAMAPKMNISRAIDQAVIRYGLQHEPELIALFHKADVHYPPQEISLLAFKKERHIQLWAKNHSKHWRYIHTYPLTAFSGHPGPKLKENDQQIPEGIYHLTAFNPFSAHHLSMMIDYPNEFDKFHARLDGRSSLGGDIFLHGKNTSVGCLAIGNKAIDQLFLLVRRVGIEHVRLIIAPNDLRYNSPKTNKNGQPKWLPELYANIKRELKPYRSEYQ